MTGPKARCFAVIAGGGTAGHVVPAISIGDALVARGHPRSSIHFVGSRRGIDRKLVPAAGFPLTLLPGRGVARKLTVENVGALFGFVAGLLLALGLLARLRPKVVVSMGGYAAAPCALVAALFRIPLVLSEQNAVPTATHRLVARFATASAVPFEGTPLPRPVLTGNPVRPEILSVDPSAEGRSAARRRLGLPDDAVVIAAFGGSLGARTINTAIAHLVRLWEGPPQLAVRHAVGSRDWASFAGTTPELGPGVVAYQAVEYEDRMPDLLAACDLAVARSGGSVAELAIVGRAAILVPLPIAPFDHQAHNAQQLVKVGAAIMVRDHELTGERLVRELEQLLGGGVERLREMGTAARRIGRPGAAEAVAALIDEKAKGRA